MIFAPEPIQLFSLDPSFDRLHETALPHEAILHDFLESNPDLFGSDWTWIGRQVRTSFGSIIDLVAMDGGGAIYGLNATRNRDASRALTDGIAALSWLQTRTNCEIDAICRSHRGTTLREAFAHTTSPCPSDLRMRPDVGFVVIVPDSSRISRASAFLRASDINLWLMEVKSFSNNGDLLCLLRAIQ